MSDKTNIKICGIANETDGLAVARLRVDFIGFVFYPPSSRYVAPEKARSIVEAIRAEFPNEAPRFMGVFVDEEPGTIAEIRRIARLDGTQFCGDESPADVARVEPLRFRSLSVQTLERLGSYEAEAYLCDTHAPEEKGGTGRSYDYEVLRPWIGHYPIIIAGGLTPETVGGVVESLHPWGVDVSSALEASPGRKDHAKMAAFVEAVQRADRTR